VTHARDANTSGYLAVPQPLEAAADNGCMKDIAAVYAEWLSATIIHSFARGCAQLVDPPVEDVDRALRLMAPLVEALEGFAIGSAIGHVAQAMRSWFGETSARELVGTLRRHIRARATTPCGDELADTLAGELAARLHPRLSRIPTAAIVDDAIEHVGGSRMLGAALDIARKDDLLAERLTTELQIGWQHYRAALQGETLSTASPLWAQWGKKVRGERDVPMREYVMQIG